jgi:hypothetical protein
MVDTFGAFSVRKYKVVSDIGGKTAFFSFLSLE